ncbi:MAG: hypothetical protein K2Y01_01465 [Rhabdochlamydiaceae bacterium]|nr:hypothetical protein [Rhabdochlamydiaceae bacterium]
MKIFLFLLISSPCFGSLYLRNDTAFQLKARIIGANGVVIGEKLVDAQKLMYLEDQIGSSDPVSKDVDAKFQNYKNSVTPYNVYWYCAEGEGELFAVCSGVATGATVSATGCLGSCSCKPPKEKKQGNDAYKQE